MARMLAARLYPASRFLPSSVERNSPSASTRFTMSTRSSSPSANTASIRSWRAPCSRRWTVKRSPKKLRRSVTKTARTASFTALSTVDPSPLGWGTATSLRLSANASPRRTRAPVARMMRITPKAALRSANGSLLPVGFSSIAQNPTSVSSLSASATATLTGSAGTLSPGPFGL